MFDQGEISKRQHVASEIPINVKNADQRMDYSNKSGASAVSKYLKSL